MNQKLAEARILAARKMPYMTHQVMSLIPVERPGLGTMAVDEYCRLYFDPAFLESRDLKHLAFVVLHEAIHVWGRHAKRCVRLLGEKPARDRLGIWRQAVDAAVNDVLEQSGLRCPDEGITPAKLGLPRNKTAEEYFDLLLERAEKEQEQDNASEAQQGNTTIRRTEANRSGDSGEGQHEGDQEADQDGNGEEAKRRRAERRGDRRQRCRWPAAAVGRWPAVARASRHGGARPEHRRSRRRQGHRTVPRAAGPWQRARRTGPQPPPSCSTPRSIRPGNCLAKVKYAVGCTSGFGDFTYRKPNRRQPQGGALLPAHVKPIPRVTVIVDTSGSMEQSDLALALGVIGNALRSPARSARPAGAGRRYRRGLRQECLSARADRTQGGGGTDMAALIVAACEERPAPKAILVVTDGYTGWPPEPVAPRVVACLTQARTADSVPKWIDTVVLNPEEGP